MERPNIIERAFQIAPECGTVDEVRQRLSREGYLNAGQYLAGKLIRTQLYDRLNRELTKPHGRQAKQ